MTTKHLSTLTAAFALALPFMTAGCGSSQSNQFSSGNGGFDKTARAEVYKPLDTQFQDRSNNIPIYSAPDAARKAMRRQPDQVIDEGGGVTAHYYNADGGPNTERLRLRYNGNRLIGKEIVPPGEDVASTKNSRSNTPASNAANYVDMREYDPKAPRVNSTDARRFNAPSATDNANAQRNDDFNAKLNVGR